MKNQMQNRQRKKVVLNKEIKILIVDDHKMVRDGIRSMLESQEKKYCFLADEAENGEVGVEKAKHELYDIIIMDYQLPILNGVDATRAILEHNPMTKILALSNYDEYMYIDNMMKTGAKGFVLKNIGPDEFISAIETVLGGKNYYSNDVAVKLISFDQNNVQMARLVRQKRDKAEMLSKRELEEIAVRLFISKRTVDTHRQNLMKKLNVKNTAGLVKHAFELKILEHN
jgi:DNA-binding NarL/FixJ family response regulator